MTSFYLLVFSLVILRASCQDDAVIDQYERIINEGIESTRNYVAPTSAEEYKPSNTKLTDLPDVDFIIVGSGAAGSIVANRLSEISRWKILVLEAGTYENNFTDIPAMSVYAKDSHYSWGFKTVPQKFACQGMVNKQCPVVRGRGVGGSTIINGLRIIRGNKMDFERWNVDGWSYQEVLPYFKKFENTSLGDEDVGYHGYKGPLPVQYYTPYSMHHYLMLTANHELGVKTVDYNGRTQLGVSGAQYAEDRGRRFSTGKAYINPIRSKSNVEVLDRSYVTKVLINENTRDAYGVVFARNKRWYRVKARKEVILSAGVVHTPQLLMLSGIGPANHLRKVGIKPLVNLPVGNNLTDHPIFQGLHFNTRLETQPKTVRQYIREFLNGVGLYTIEVGTQTFSFHETPYASAPESPDLEVFYTYPNPSVNIPARTSGYKQDVLDAVNNEYDSTRNVQLPVLVLDSKSRGTVRLRSSDPFAYPLIDLNLLSDKENHDINIIKEGIRFVDRLQNTNAMKLIQMKRRRIDLPACKGTRYLSEGYWNCAIKELTTSGYHMTGTCQMGNKMGEGAVVDPYLRVFGIKGLRIVDASVVPFISGHTVGVTMMLAEKISDAIKVQHGVSLMEIDFSVFDQEVLNNLRTKY